VVVFDPAGIKDNASFEDPRSSPDGIDYGFVNGAPTVDHGRHTGVRTGGIVPPLTPRRSNASAGRARPYSQPDSPVRDIGRSLGALYLGAGFHEPVTGPSVERWRPHG
jgi:hypothetical protein